jgi:hypothetical protein
MEDQIIDILKGREVGVTALGATWTLDHDVPKVRYRAA